MSRPVLGALGLVGIVSVLRAYAAFNFPLTADETYYWSWSLHPSFGYTDHPPMVAWLITAGTWFGHSFGAVRLPFIIAGAVSALAIGMAASIIAGNARAGAFAAIVFTLIPQTKLEFAESIPDGAYVLSWALALWAAAALARRVSPQATIGLGCALAATVYSRTFGWALVAGVLAWALTARRDLLRPVALACAMSLIAYIPFLVWNASVGWETFAFEFYHRNPLNTVSVAFLVTLDTIRFLVFGGLLVALTLALTLRRPPYIPLIAWTALPLPIALMLFSFLMKTEAYWILGPAVSLSVACGIRLADANIWWPRLTFAVLGIATAYATASAVFLALPEAAQAAAIAAQPSVGAQFSSGVYAYRPLADDLRADAAAGVTIYTDRYETSSELLWYGVPSDIVVATGQLTQWMRWYRPAVVPQHADLVAFRTPFGGVSDLESNVRAAYAHVGTPKRLEYRYAGRTEGTFYVTRLDGPRPTARGTLRGM
jgi:4-amino-4-deoxy-L-arabinose transferase-like glycosyltransferase